MRKLIILILLIAIIACEKEEYLNEEEPVFTTMLDYVNYFRTHGATDCDGNYYPPVSKLEWDSKLELAAKYQSTYMNDTKEFSHTWKDGTELTDRLAKFGCDYTIAGENIAISIGDAEAIRQWICSSGHCENLMKAGFKYTAIVRVGNYWTQVLTN